jgi:AraC-like DNA-binding protein
MNDCSNENPNDGDSRCQLMIATEAADATVEANPAAARDFVASIREAIETLSCAEDYPTIRTTAEFVGMSVRTLQRRLARAGATHHMLVAQARFATAAAVLERTDAKILELALDLGYSDHANFTRAFRRWAGCAPRVYRSNNTRHERAPDPSLLTSYEERRCMP